MMDAVIEEVRGRRIRVGDHWLCDFASCNYLGFDLHPDIMASVEGAIRRWGTHPSWSRLLGNPRLYVDIEDQLTELLGAPDTLVLPTITLIHTSVIPVLAGQGAVLVDAQAHKTIYEGAAIARGPGPPSTGSGPTTPATWKRSCARCPPQMSRMFCIDGVNSMTGNVPDLPEYARICREYDALLYVDDAHGFGVIGERPSAEMPYGHRGNSIVRYFDESYDNVVLVAGFSKAYSSLARVHGPAHLAQEPPEGGRRTVPLFGPSPIASLATVLAGFKVNDAEGDDIRTSLRLKTKSRAGPGAQFGFTDAEHIGFPGHRAPPGPRRRHRRRGPVPVRPGDLRDAGRLPAGAPVPGRFPGPGDGGQRRQRNRTAQRGPGRAR